MPSWMPWRALAERPKIEFAAVDLPDGAGRAIYVRRGEDRAILVDRRLGPAERLAAVAHELVHDERGGGCHRADLPAHMRPEVAREERRVDDIVAARLVPLDDLEAFVAATVDAGDAVTAGDVAEAFEVPFEVADRAVRLLLLDQRAGRRRVA